MSAFRSIGCCFNGIYKRSVAKLVNFCFVVLLISFSSQLLADTFSPEEKLAAIKNSLVNLALESEVRLGAAAFIDTAGILHESSTITSDINVLARARLVNAQRRVLVRSEWRLDR